MSATGRSEGLRVSTQKKSVFWLVFFCLLALAGNAAAADRAQRKVYETYFAFPTGLPAGFEAKISAYNTGEAARVRIEPVNSAPGEFYEALLPQGGSKLLRFSWIRPGRLIKLIATSLQVDAQLLVYDLSDNLVEAFPIDLAEAQRHDYVLPIADANLSCAAANPDSVAANTTLYLTSMELLSPDDYELRAYSAGGSLLDTEAVPAALLGAMLEVDLDEVFDSEILDDTRIIRVYSDDDFTGYGLATVAPDDVLGILPTVASTYWMIQEADGWDPKDHTADLVFYNPGTVGAPVKIDADEFTVPAGGVTVKPWPGEEAEIDADLPVALFIAHAQIGGCGVTSRIACDTNRPWSVPLLTEWTDVLVSYTDTPW